MPYLGLIAFLVVLAAVVDIILSDEARVRNLPKLAWLGVVLLLPIIGGVIWFALGRPTGRAPTPSNGGSGRQVARYPDDDDEFLWQVRRRAEEQRRKATKDAAKPAEEPDEE